MAGGPVGLGRQGRCEPMWEATVGRASNRKKAAREGHGGASRSDHDHGARALETARRAQVLLGAEKMEQESAERRERDAAASLEIGRAHV